MIFGPWKKVGTFYRAQGLTYMYIRLGVFSEDLRTILLIFLRAKRSEPDISGKNIMLE